MGRNKMVLAGHPRPCETRLYNTMSICFLGPTPLLSPLASKEQFNLKDENGKHVLFGIYMCVGSSFVRRWFLSRQRLLSFLSRYDGKSSHPFRVPPDNHCTTERCLLSQAANTILSAAVHGEMSLIRNMTLRTARPQAIPHNNAEIALLRRRAAKHGPPVFWLTTTASRMMTRPRSHGAGSGTTQAECESRP